jgi:hypothetical protein
VKALESIPKNHAHVAVANQQLLEHYNTFNISSIELLSKKFKVAYYGKLPRESELYFSELAGEKGLNSLLPLSFGSDADLLISLALVIRSKNE